MSLYFGFKGANESGVPFDRFQACSQRSFEAIRIFRLPKDEGKEEVESGVPDKLPRHIGIRIQHPAQFILLVGVKIATKLLSQKKFHPAALIHG